MSVILKQSKTLDRLVFGYDDHTERIEHGKTLKDKGWEEVSFKLDTNNYHTYITYEKEVKV